MVTSTEQFAQDQLDLITARQAVLAASRESALERKTFWEGIGENIYIARATAAVARIDAELAQLALREVEYTKALTTGVFSLGRMNEAGEWVK
jgi:hypothetical protein